MNVQVYQSCDPPSTNCFTFQQFCVYGQPFKRYLFNKNAKENVFFELILGLIYRKLIKF